MTDSEVKDTATDLDHLSLKASAGPTFQRDKRPHLNIVFTGHVDAGKSTCSGHILFITGNVDERTMDKNKREAIRKHRDGWEFAYVMDVTEDERDRGKTHEMGSAYFETEAKRYTILDAPGHKCFVSSMIGGASQADVAILVISSRRGEFETGFEGNGQTREHALLLRTCGVGHLIVAINKLDDPSVNWSAERYSEIRGKLAPFLKSLGYIEGKNCTFMPISGITGAGLREPVSADLVKSYYTGPSLLGYLDGLADVKRSTDPNVRFLVQGSYRDDGKLTVYGKLESGIIKKGDKLLIMPTKRETLVDSLLLGEFSVEDTEPGDFLHIRLKQSEEEEIHPGYVLCKPGMPLKSVHYFQAQVMISDKPLISNGFVCMLHLHNAECEIVIDKVLAKVDRKTNKVLAKNPGFARNGESVIVRIKTIAHPVVVELYKDFEKLGRLNLREEGKTIAFGVVTKIYENPAQ
mmetsp:Transcript_25745/g.40163  ORF Transcript_25745/g.40163 Transcript_25745/m.40163 type:complete len:464 (-) Transcript_25745:58-1449(-)